MVFTSPRSRLAQFRKHSLGKVAVVLATGMFTLAGGLAATPAQASVQDCPKGYFCFWADESFSSAHGMGLVNRNVPDLAAHLNRQCPGGTWDGCISSFYNNTDTPVVVYDDRDFGNQRAGAPELVIYSREGFGRVPDAGGPNGTPIPMDDKISSILIATS